MKRQVPEAIAIFERLRDKDDTSRSRCELAWAYALAGRTEDATRELEQARGMTQSQKYPYDEALVLTALGRTEAALDALDRAFEQRDPTMVNLRHDPRLASLRSNPRFTRVILLMRSP
jgi:tetratricopeptide (TPR) repeat protein